VRIAVNSKIVNRACIPLAHSLLHKMIYSGGGILMVSGPSGIGKSTLAAQLQAMFGDCNLCGDCEVPAGCEEVPPLRTAATRPEIEPSLGMWNRLAGSAAARNIPTHFGSDRFASALQLLAALTQRDPRPILFEDIHATDPDSLTLLAHIAPVIADTGAKLILTTRGADAIDDPLSRTAHHAIQSQSQVINLRGFDEAEVTARLNQHGVPEAIATQFAAVYLHESSGNPLILDHLIEATWPSQGQTFNPAAIHAAAVGSTVVSIWAQELARLPHEDCEVLGVISELGSYAGAPLVRKVFATLGYEDIEPSFQRLIAHGLITISPNATSRRGVISATHPGITEALHLHGRTLPPSVHRVLAQTLSQLGGEPRSVLNQLLQAGDLVSASERNALAQQAISHAEQAGDDRAAAEAWEVVISAADAAPTDRLAAAEAWRRVGERTRSRALARDVSQDFDPHHPEAMAQAAIIFADGAEFHGEATIAVRLLRRARELLEALMAAEPDRQEPHRFWVEVTSALALLEMTMPTVGPSPTVHVELSQSTVANMVRWHWVTRPEVAQPQADAAEQKAATLRDPSLIATSGLVWRLTHQAPQHGAARRDRSERARRVLSNHTLRAKAVHAMLLDTIEMGDVGEAKICLGELADLAAGSGDPAVRWRYAHTTSMLERLSARVDAAEHHSSVAGTYGALAGEPTAVIVRVEQRTVMGVDQLSEIAPVLALGTERDTVQHPPMLAGVMWLLSELQHLGVPSTDVPRPVLHDLVNHLATPRSHEQNWLCTVGFTASAVAKRGEVKLAAQMLELLDPWADRVVRESSGVIALGYAERLRGELLGAIGAVDEAVAALASAQVRNAAAGWKWAVMAGEIARLQLLAGHGRIEDGELRQQATRLAQRCSDHGLRLFAAQARRLGAGSDPLPLAERQLQILSGLAGGATYQQIADAIGYSHGTVRGEVSKLYAALHVDTRDQAVAEAEWRGLLPASAFGWGPSKM